MAGKDGDRGQKVSAAERRVRVVELRKRGHTFRSIASRLDSPLVTVYRDYSAVMADLIARGQAEATQHRQLELERLDRMLKKLDPKVRAGDPKAIAAAVRVIEQQCKLRGLYAPSRHVHGGDSDSPPIRHEHQHRLSADEFRQLPLEDRVRYLREQMSVPGRN